MCSRDLAAHHNAGALHTDIDNQFLETVPAVFYGTGFALVAIDDSYLFVVPTQRDRLSAKVVLKPSALLVVEHLSH